MSDKCGECGCSGVDFNDKEDRVIAITLSGGPFDGEKYYASQFVPTEIRIPFADHVKLIKRNCIYRMNDDKMEYIGDE